jgi:phage-related protein
VRDWLKSLSVAERKAIGEDIKTVQFGWPLGMPLVRKMDTGLWETRIHLQNRTMRVFFTIDKNSMVLLHGFVKKSGRTPADDLALAKNRLKQVKG